MENSSYIKDKGKYAQDLERYRIIVDYFKDNPDRMTKKNTNYLNNLSDLLRKYLFNVSSIFEYSIKELKTELSSFLEKNLRTKLNYIESSRKEGNVIDQWIGELI
jgi:hypothetical protein